MSDVILSLNGDRNSSILRGNNRFFPITGDKIISEKLSIYYEVYNTDIKEFETGNFEQTIKFEEIETDKNIFETVGSIFSSSEEVEIISDFSISKNNDQLYFEIDLSELEDAEYKFTLKLKNKNTGEELISSQNILIIK